MKTNRQMLYLASAMTCETQQHLLSTKLLISLGTTNNHGD